MSITSAGLGLGVVYHGSQCLSADSRSCFFHTEGGHINFGPLEVTARLWLAVINDLDA